MDSLGMVGTTFRRSGQAGIEQLTFAPDVAAARSVTLHEACGFAESVYLATCNRVEVIFVRQSSIPVAEYRRRIFSYFAGADSTMPDSAAEALQAAKALHAYQGEGAAEHLFCVAAALDSMNPGEAQILGQVKNAFRNAALHGTAGAQLGLLFDEAFQAAKRVRASTKLGTRALSMLSLAIGLIEERLQRGRGQLVVIGAGEMAVQCGDTFGAREDVDLVFVNRTLSKAEDLSRRNRGRAVLLSTFLKDPGTPDVIVTATAAQEPLLDRRFFEAVTSVPSLIVDLAVSRDTDPDAASEWGAELYDIDRLSIIAEQNRKAREADIAQARIIIDKSLDAVRRRFVERDLGPLLKALRGRYQEAASIGVERLLGGPLRGLDEEQRRELARWAQAFVNRIAHIPTVGLKRLAFEHGMDAVRSYLDGVGSEARATSQGQDHAQSSRERNR